jgi:hypothetical protein
MSSIVRTQPKINGKPNKMKVEKITDQFTLTKVGEEYHLDLRFFKSGSNTTSKLRVSEINSNNFIVKVFCGCTKSDNLEIIDATTVEFELTYNQCDASFTKTVELIEPQKTILLKIKGQCFY